MDAQLKLNEVRDKQVFRERQCAMLARKLDVLREGQKILGLLKALSKRFKTPITRASRPRCTACGRRGSWRDPETGAVGWNSAPSDACIYFDSTHAHLFLNDDKNTDEEARLPHREDQCVPGRVGVVVTLFLQKKRWRP